MSHGKPKGKETKRLVVLGGRGDRAAGTVWLVGAGPGDPDLLTVKALRVLQTADVVVHDGLVSDEILDLAPQAAQRISVAKRKSRHSYAQDEINRMLVAFAQDGLNVVRLKGGDPFIFGRGGEELEACRAAGVDCHVVPGVTAALAAGANAGAAEDERIAALQADHVQPLLGECDQHPVDLVLGVGMARLALGDADATGRDRRQVEDFIGDQAVMDDDLGGLQRLERLEGQQLGIAGPRAHQPDRPGRATARPAQDDEALAALVFGLAVRHCF